MDDDVNDDDDGEVVFVDDVFPLLLFFLCASSRAQTRARFCTKALLKGQRGKFFVHKIFFFSFFFLNSNLGSYLKKKGVSKGRGW